MRKFIHVRTGKVFEVEVKKDLKRHGFAWREIWQGFNEVLDD